MIRIQLDQTWRERLLGLDKTIEFCDESGKVLGQFVPSEDLLLQAARQRLLAITEEELDRFRDEEGEYTLDEILQRLEKS
ncbi:MAG: hypothetical protein QM703_19015 [Gemmatales bacterium]